jgi:hypothetical protein
VPLHIEEGVAIKRLKSKQVLHVASRIGGGHGDIPRRIVALHDNRQIIEAIAANF